jgi:hypothetical protein
MKRTVIALGLVGLMALPALASSEKYVGTRKADRMYGGNGSQIMRGLGGNDHLGGQHGPDTLYGGPGQDRIWTGKSGAHRIDAAWGGRGNDFLNNSGSGNTGGYLNGGPGHDICVVDRKAYHQGRDIVRSCETVRFR